MAHGLGITAGLALAALAATPAGAAVQCGNGQSNATFQRLVNNPDPRVMQTLVGTWYSETR